MILILSLLLNTAHAATIAGSETFKNAINAAAIGQAASDAKKAAEQASDARFSLEQWQAAQTAIMEANAKRAEADQTLNRRYTFWGIMVNAFSVAFLALLAKIGSTFRGELRSLPEVIHQLSLIGSVIKELENNTNNKMDLLLTAKDNESQALQDAAGLAGEDRGRLKAEKDAQLKKDDLKEKK